MPTAILIDGSFFLKQHMRLHGSKKPAEAAKDLQAMCFAHIKYESKNEKTRMLYRTFFYDCPPLQKKAHYPMSHRGIDFSKTPTALWRTEFHNELRKMRKVALRFGCLNDHSASWTIKKDKLKELLKGSVKFEQLTDDDFKYEAPQKGVDMRIGLDIASMAYKRQVDQIILVSGDSDFVPAAKLARREGIDFILDPLWTPIRPDLHEHIDGLHSVWAKPKIK